jgi:hypothetical protein
VACEGLISYVAPTFSPFSEPFSGIRLNVFSSTGQAIYSSKNSGKNRQGLSGKGEGDIEEPGLCPVF